MAKIFWKSKRKHGYITIPKWVRGDGKAYFYEVLKESGKVPRTARYIKRSK